MSALITFCHVDNVEVLSVCLSVCLSAVGNATKKEKLAIERRLLIIVALPLPAITMGRAYFIANYAADKQNNNKDNKHNIQAIRQHVAFIREQRL